MNQHILFGAILLACSAAQGQPSEGSKGSEAWIAHTSRGIQLVNIECGETFFDPAQIVVRANVPVHLSVRGTSDVLQFVSQDFLPVNHPIGKAPTLHVFVPTTPGQYDMSCQSRSGTAGPIRKGTLIVR